MTRPSAIDVTLRHARSNLAEETIPMHMAHTTDGWTIDELHRLPDDGNKYELVRGELFVTPPPSVAHEEMAAVLGRILDTYVAAANLGRVHRPRAVLRVLDSEVEPDLMVRGAAGPRANWADAPLPLLVAEIVSESTRRRDNVHKRAFYLEAGVSEYWIVDAESRSIRIARPIQPDIVVTELLTWHPATANEAFTINVQTFFRDALG
jgi:Uma2 family endonuclease